MLLKKQFFINTFLLLCCWMLWQVGVAQETRPVCGFDQIHKTQLAQDADYKRIIEANEAAIQAYIRQNPKGGRTEATVYKIPCVVHIIHTGGAIGTAYNPTDAVITTMISNMTKAFRNQAPYNMGVGTDVEIEFELAKRSPSCTVTNGINRVDGSVLPNYVAGGVGTGGATDAAVKALSYWSNADYYNIWIVNKIDGNDGTVCCGSFTAGYAYFPGGTATTDGTVMLASQTGAVTTITHELGHALNLFHTFEGSTGAGNCPANTTCSTDGDKVCDTDPHDDNPFQCTTNPCGSVAVLNNYMSYSNCASHNYTAGQTTRMRAALETLRSGLISSQALVAPTGSPIAGCAFTTAASTGNCFGIANVTFNTINLSSSSSGGDGAIYVDRSCLQQTTVTAGASVNLSVKTFFTNNQKVLAFIDYNNNGSFADVGEQVLSGSTNSGNSYTLTGSVVIPMTAVTNTPLRMRVIADFSAATITACSTTGATCGGTVAGQAEDYGIIVVPSATPTITTTGTLSAFSSCAGSVSSEQNYTVAGTNLTANIVITAPTGFELSLTSGGTFTSTLNLSPTAGTVNTTTIYVRQTSGASNGATGNITHTSTGATQKDVAIPVSTVNALPTITLGTINSVNTSATSFTIPYTATTGSPNQYSITTGGATPMPSFVAVTNQALPASPITVTIPASAANTYNFTLTVRNTTTGCVSANVPFTLTVTAIPSTTIYVRTDGNDANNGLSNTAAGAKLTLQGAFTAVGDGNTVVLNAGTYTEAAGLTGKSVTLQGVGNPTVQTIIVNGAGKTLTLSGNVNISQMLDLQAGDLAAGGNLTLLATPTQQAMLIQGSGTTITGNVNVQRYLRANSGTTGLGYRFLSSPVTSATFNEISELSPVVNAAFNTSATPGKVTPFPTVYSYDATRAGDPAKTFTTSPFPEFDKGWVSPAALSDAMLVGRGYTVNTSANQVVSITGTLNNGNIAVPIVTGNAASLGYNLVGNPYPSPIRWSAVRALSTGVNDAIYQNMATGQYTGSWASFVGGVGTNGATDSIAVMQGFFVVANAAGNINFNNTVRATNYSNPNSFRTENGVNHKGLVRLALTNSANKTDETVVYFRDEATETFDSQYDAYKFQLNGGNFSNIYTTDNKAEKANLYAINALPILTDDLIVPVNLQAWTDGEQRIALTEKVNFSREVKVFLKDKTTNTLHDFAKGAYVANLSKGVTAGRYELVFKPQFTAEELSNGVLAIYPNPSKEKSTLTLTDDFKGEVTLRLVDVAGREVWKNTLQKQTTVLQTTVDLSTLPTGLYMVEILGKNKLVQKVVKE